MTIDRFRLAVAKSLGWTHIDCTDADDDAITAEMWEIVENLHRLDLSKEQRDEHIRRYAELLQSRQSVAVESKREDGRGHRREGPAAIIARETGLSKRTIERALNPAPPPELKNVLPDHDVVTIRRRFWHRETPAPAHSPRV